MFSSSRLQTLFSSHEKITQQHNHAINLLTQSRQYKIYSMWSKGDELENSAKKKLNNYPDASILFALHYCALAFSLAKEQNWGNAASAFTSAAQQIDLMLKNKKLLNEQHRVFFAQAFYSLAHIYTYCIAEHKQLTFKEEAIKALKYSINLIGNIEEKSSTHYAYIFHYCTLFGKIKSDDLEINNIHQVAFDRLVAFNKNKEKSLPANSLVNKLENESDQQLTLETCNIMQWENEITKATTFIDALKHGDDVIMKSPSLIKRTMTFFHDTLHPTSKKLRNAEQSSFCHQLITKPGSP